MTNKQIIKWTRRQRRLLHETVYQLFWMWRIQHLMPCGWRSIAVCPRYDVIHNVRPGSVTTITYYSFIFAHKFQFNIAGNDIWTIEHDDGLAASRLKHCLTFRFFFVASTGIKLSISQSWKWDCERQWEIPCLSLTRNIRRIAVAMPKSVLQGWLASLVSASHRTERPAGNTDYEQHEWGTSPVLSLKSDKSCLDNCNAFSSIRRM